LTLHQACTCQRSARYGDGARPESTGSQSSVWC